MTNTDDIFPLTTPEGDVLPKYSAAQIRYIKEHGSRGVVAAKIAAAREQGQYFVNGVPEAEYLAAHPKPPDPLCIELDPDVAGAFPTSEAVNTALRGLLQHLKPRRGLGGVGQRSSVGCA